MSSKNGEHSFNQHVNSSMTIFSVFILIFVLIKTFVIYTSAGKSNATINSMRNISTFAVAALFFMFSYFTTISATEEQMVCGQRNHKIAFYATIFPFIFIYSIGIFFISIFPGWIRCFSNTFGSSILEFCGLETTIVDSLNQQSGATSEIFKLYSKNPRILLNELEINMDGSIPEHQLSPFDIKTDDNEKIKLLKQYILCKESIGEGIWHYLLGIITILVSYNTLLADNCNAFTLKKNDFRNYLNNKFQKNWNHNGKFTVKHMSAAGVNLVHCIVQSVPETMIQTHGSYTETSSFKMEHSGETFRLPHYNLDTNTYFRLYRDYLKMLMDTSLDLSIFHVNDIEHKMNLVNLENADKTKIEDFINKRFKSKSYAFYICLQDTKQYDIERSLITNSTFQEECIICYQTNDLKHYYRCSLRDKSNHHGICGTCYLEWNKTNPKNSCPLCRADKR